MTDAVASRPALVRRGLRLNYLTIGYNALEAIVALATGLTAGSVALVGFGVDSVIEVTASIAAQWRLRADLNPVRRERVEQLAVRIIGATFLALVVYVTYDGVNTLVKQEKPDGSVVGVILLAMSVIVMPLLARAKRRVAGGLRSSALTADATQTALCAYLSLIALIGVALNTLLGWWWADPVAALGMVPIIAREGIQGLRGETTCTKCADD